MGIEDRLKKQIDQLGKALAKALSDLMGLKSKGQVNDGIGSVNQTLKTELDLDLKAIAEMETEDFIQVLKVGKGVSNNSLAELADVLLLIADETEMEYKGNLYQKCLLIYEYLEKNENIYSLERRWKIEKIRSLL